MGCIIHSIVSSHPSRGASAMGSVKTCTAAGQTFSREARPFLVSCLALAQVCAGMTDCASGDDLLSETSGGEQDGGPSPSSPVVFPFGQVETGLDLKSWI